MPFTEASVHIAAILASGSSPCTAAIVAGCTSDALIDASATSRWAANRTWRFG